MDNRWKLNCSKSLMNGRGSFLLFVLVGMALVGCSGREDAMTDQESTLSEEPAELVLAAPATTEIEVVQATEASQEVIPFSISSPAFLEGEPIPNQFSCDGEELSPALEWSGTPEGTASFVLVMDDPDAPGKTWVHWILFNIPGDASGLPAAIPATAVLDDGSLHGANSWGRFDYGGPCPPGGTHRYFFKLYALDSVLELVEGADLGEVEQALHEHMLGETSLMGIYTR